MHLDNVPHQPVADILTARHTTRVTFGIGLADRGRLEEAEGRARAHIAHEGGATPWS